MRTASDVIVRVEGMDHFASKQKEVSAVIHEVGFCVIRGIFDPDDVLAEYDRLAADFRPSNDVRRSGPIVRNMKNFQRLDCGDYAQVNARFSRMLTRFFWNPSDHFSRHFQVLQQVRDRIGGRMTQYRQGCYELGGREYYELPKILQYPPGGGFMNDHYDGYNNDGVFNVGMSVTRKGRHFSTGGIFYKYRNGEECPVEDVLEPGDIYVHDEQAGHGVHAIDPSANIDLSSLTGRIALILSSETFK